MKKKVTLASLFISLLAVGSFACLANNNVVNKADAFIQDYTYSYGKETGVWQLVEDISDINNGDEVIMGAGDIFLTGMFSDYYWTDKSYFCEGTKISNFGGQIGQDGRVYITEEAHVLKIQVQIYGAGSSYRFIAKNTEFKSFDSQSDYNYYKDKFDIVDKYMTFEDYNSEKNPWIASFHRTHFVSFEEDNSEWTYDEGASDGARMVFKNMFDNSRFITAANNTTQTDKGSVYAFGGLDSNYSNYNGVNLYKKVTQMVDEYQEVVVETQPDRTYYYDGDQIILTGLEVVIRPKNYGYGSYTYLYYNNESRFFSVGNAEVDISNPFSTATTATVTYGDGLVTFEININVDNNPNYTFTKVTSPLDEYRGTYIIVNETENRYLNGLAGDGINSYTTNSSYFDSSKTDSSIGPISYYMKERAFEITRTRIGESSYYHLRNSEGKYLINNNKNLGWANTATADNAITINNDCSISMNGRYLKAYQYGFDLWTSGYTNATLYKLNVVENVSDKNFSEMCDFADYFESATSEACQNRNVTPAIWSAIEAEYNKLSVDSQGYLATLTYTHGEPVGAFTVDDLVDRYDVIITAYGYSDFMFRKENSAYQQNAVRYSELTTSSISEGAIIVVIVSLISLSACGGLLLLKKKRQ